MSIDVLRRKTPQQVYDDVSGFAVRYVSDWEAWLMADQEFRPKLFGRILRKWQATRPRAMRRLREEARHEAPFLDDLLSRSAVHVQELKDLSVLTIGSRTLPQAKALSELWAIFLELPTSGASSCVGITKAILLLTEGRIGPALDSQVRGKMGIAAPSTCGEWLVVLQEIGEDIAAFESVNGPLASAVPPHFAQLACGRLYDMALGPR